MKPLERDEVSKGKEESPESKMKLREVRLHNFQSQNTMDAM